MERKSCQKLLVLFVLFLSLAVMTVSTGNAQWWSSSGSASSSSTSSSSGSISDTEKPVVTSFAAPGSVVTRIIPITSFTATDNVSVTGYCIKTSGSGNCTLNDDWTSRPPTFYIPPARYKGSVNIHAFARDAAGNISAYKSAYVTGVPTAIAPDLVVTSVTHSAVTITVTDRTFTITDIVTNKGTAIAGVTKMRYELYYFGGWWTSFPKSSPLTGTRYVPVLRPGESSIGTTTVLVPRDAEARRDWNVRAWADSEDVVDELNENNSYVSSTTIIVQ